MTSPYELTLLIDIHVTSKDNWTTADSELRGDTVEDFQTRRIIKNRSIDSYEYELTDLGIAWLQSMLNTPLPTLGYYNQMGERIKVNE